MNIHNEHHIKWYLRLLVDVRVVTGVTLVAPDDLSYNWLLIEAPVLEKQVLMYIEGTRAETPDIPEWLIPLWHSFIQTKDAVHLRCLRQLLLFCYKAEYESNEEQLKAACAAFCETDESIAIWDNEFNSHLREGGVFRSARQIVGRVIYKANWSEIEPSHGPGAVYPPAKPWRKSLFGTYYPSIAQYYPYDQFFYGIPSFWKDIMVDEVTGVIQEREEIVAKLTAVPKDSRGPRLICVHPREAIWIQQGLRKILEKQITYSPLLNGSIKFRDQSQNGSLALDSSRSGYLCTLDLKEASDRMSCELVRYLFGDYVYNRLSCCRATHVSMLDGRVLELRKWAPMGNALTFPVQSLVFYALVRAGIRLTHYTDCGDIYVFGDDILFPVKYYEGAIRGLAMAGFVPNMAKTFRKGLFRESCGVDAYNGINVTPLRIKKHDESLFRCVLSLLNLAKRLRLAGYEHCASAIYSDIRARHGYLPLCNNHEAQGYLEYVDRDLGWLILNEPRLRFRRSIQEWAVPSRLVQSRIIAPQWGDWYLLQDSLLRIRKDGISERGTEYPVPHRDRLTCGWSDCYFTPTKGEVVELDKYNFSES